MFCNNLTSKSAKDGVWDVVAIGEEMEHERGGRVGVGLGGGHIPAGALPSLAWSTSHLYHHSQTGNPENHLLVNTIRG